MRAFLLAAVAALTLGSVAPPTYAAANDRGRGHHGCAFLGRGLYGPRVYRCGYYAPYYYAPYAYSPYGITPSYPVYDWSRGFVSPSFAPDDWSRGFVSPSVPLGVVPPEDVPLPAEPAPAPVCTPRYDVPTGIYVDCPQRPSPAPAYP